ncbi:hypothetical protein K493DRAFT_215049 [Basidiobolus meristosporus CBS 931.73]|uniref:Uncharacterized protein n=1 Tax=Basidiobolus meristosporus CBS 931.73 TaxID=1314790 RepID=A0A1Y1YIX5_9FUNG|nr:hypothetical protein K493DRAFT_215049 [Basidiobolus meristosporus CBS 931.73]|eukprot:ORX97971.1 hypothetical protein K493DRAFT_215049 [Basidiobolus meristosporus CBS 931.73]
MNQKAQSIRINIPPISEYSRPLTRPTKRITLILILATLLILTVLIHVFLLNDKTRGPDQISFVNGLENSKTSPRYSDLDEIIIVAGHAIYKGDEYGKQLESDKNWVLEEFQKNGQVSVFLKHIEKGVSLAKDRSNSLLVFSGGQTRNNAGARSEAQSYWVKRMGLLDTREISDRTTTEEHARDSYENVLFSLCRFHEVTGSYPKNITVVGFEFKRTRFFEIHRVALGIPEER